MLESFSRSAPIRPRAEAAAGRFGISRMKLLIRFAASSCSSMRPIAEAGTNAAGGVVELVACRKFRALVDTPAKPLSSEHASNSGNPR